jgi:6-phosphogluconate dehydrogenase
MQIAVIDLGRTGGCKNAASEALVQAERFSLNVADIADLWPRGNFVTSWILDLNSAALAEDVTHSKFSAFVGDSGEGRWTVQAAAETVLSAMPGFGGQVEPKAPHD